MKIKRLLALALAVLTCFTVGTSCALIDGVYDVNSLTVPTYTSDDNVDFTAYSGPTIENWTGSSGNVNTVTEYHYQKLADAGFTKVLALHEGGKFRGSTNPWTAIENKMKRAEEDALRSLEQAEKVGVKYYVRDWNFYGFSREVKNLGFTRDDYEEVIAKIFSEDNPYIHHAAYGGNFAFDEPSYDELADIKLQVELYLAQLEKLGAKGEPMVNLYPAHVGATALGGFSYEEYVDYYFKNIAPMTGYVSYDFYPFKKDKYTGSNLKTQYLFNLELMANKCKNTRDADVPVELRTFIQTVGDFTGLRPMTSIGDIRFQIYSALAFGSREIIYYTYAEVNDSGSSQDWALLNYMDGTYTWLYDCCKTVNNEVHAFEDVYLNFDWEGTLYYNSDPMVDNQNFANLTSASKSHPRIAKFEGTQDTLMTFFKDKSGNDAFMIVNMTDPYFKLDDTVTVKFNDAKGLLMYRNGQAVVVPLKADGSYTFQLYPGEGRFVIPLK